VGIIKGSGLQQLEAINY